ncbi:hypothetical protein N9498_02360 [Porticoccaceae bacterium]|nr:hypothetical protein [Porticoccaceae bacterium]
MQASVALCLPLDIAWAALGWIRWCIESIQRTAWQLRWSYERYVALGE